MSATVSVRGRARVLALARRSDLATAELFRVLGERGLPGLVVRGPAIARRLYPNGGRAYTDTDLLVADTHAREITGLLAGLGYRPYTAFGFAQHWRREGDGAEMDLHAMLWGVRVSSAELWQAFGSRAATLAIGGVDVPVPDLPGVALVVALHAAQHGAVVGHTLDDLDRAAGLLDGDVWEAAAVLAEEVRALVAFRQGLTMRPDGKRVLAGLGLAPAISPQTVLLRNGTKVPGYLLEPATSRERLKMLGRRFVPGRDEMSAFFDPRAASSTPRLIAAHARRPARLPPHTVRLALNWRHARTRAKTLAETWERWPPRRPRTSCAPGRSQAS
jgi:Uncharacterised nucleotidyltransferase